MLFVMDIGNTNIHVGIYKGKELLKDWHIKTDKEKTGQQYRKEISSKLHGVKPRGGHATLRGVKLTT